MFSLFYVGLLISETLSQKMNQFKTIQQADGTIELLPINQQKQSLIWLHGLGDSSQGYLDFFNKINIVKEGTKILLLQAPKRRVTLNKGYKMASWFDVKVPRSQNSDFLNFENTVSIDEIEQSRQQIRKYLISEVEKFGSKNVFIGGFSQGCAMALDIGLSFQESLGGILGLSGYLFPITQFSNTSINTPIYLFHGSKDQIIPELYARKTYERLLNHHYELFIYQNMRHEISQEVINKMKEIFQPIIINNEL